MKNKLPHFQVYTRIARSKIHGVGVVAIRKIKKGTYIFYGDNDKLCRVKKERLKFLSKELKRLYEDFCIKKGPMYFCPVNFNRMTPAWYLNHSKKPNVASDKSYRFYTIRDIKQNEELTTDYDSYSEVGRRRLTLKTTSVGV